MRLVAHDTLGSTNAEALALARAGERGPLWIAAAAADRGPRPARARWISEPGNLYASLLLTEPGAAPSIGRSCRSSRRSRSHDAVVGRRRRASSRSSRSSGRTICCSTGAKFAGILIEGEGGERRLAVAVGIGVNCAQPPDRHGLSGDRPRGCRLRRSRPRRSFCRALAHDARSVWRSGTRARASPPSAPIGSRAPPVWARTSGCGSPTARVVGRFEALDEAGGLAAALPDGSVDDHRGRRRRSSARVRRAATRADRSRMARPTDELVFAPLGGVGEIGMNLVDLRLRRRAPPAMDRGRSRRGVRRRGHLPGVDLILPDIRYLVEERRNLLGIVLTHAHEDHFGALLDLWPRLKLPVYATPFTAALLAGQARERAGRARNPGERSCRSAAASRSGRSTSSSSRWPIRSRNRTPDHPHAARHGAAHRRLEDRSDAGHRPADRRGQAARARRRGLLALIGDSTNAVREGRSPSETDVAKMPRRADPERAARASRSPPSPPTWRGMRAVALAAAALRARGRRGRPRHGAHRRRSRARPAISTASRISVGSTSTAICRRDKVLALCTGSQGEPRAALSRIAAGRASGRRACRAATA